MCMCVCVCVCVAMCLCVSVCVSMCVCVITPVNTEKREAPVPSRRARGRQKPQELQDSIPSLRSLPSPSPTLPSSSNTQYDVQRPAVCAELVGLLFLLAWS